MNRLSPRKSSRRRSTLIRASSAASLAMSSSSSRAGGQRRLGAGRPRSVRRAAAARAGAAIAILARASVGAQASAATRATRHRAAEAPARAQQRNSRLHRLHRSRVENAHAALSVSSGARMRTASSGGQPSLDERDERVQVERASRRRSAPPARRREPRIDQLLVAPADDLVGRVRCSLSSACSR